ncbi:cilia- and flagella-associated protein 300-like isoform X2 [Montipora foliosa]|uniref:cilia- and flagella-associated protein 300-like isoform X2 n=1 Tax=Montipora foliosa TaxID=591990 RepID=UPI0035F1701E
MADDEKHFSFQFVPNKTFPGFASSDVQELFVKWGMISRSKVQMFSYDQLFRAYQKDKFVLDFFQDPAVISSLQLVSSTNTWAPLNVKVSSITAKVISCSVTSMGFFDRLQEQGIIRESGKIRKCFDEFYDDFVISDELRKVLLLEEAETYPIFSDADRNEFIFLIFKHLCLGGQVCQYEDDVSPYLETTKTLYKELISVHKDATTKKLQVGSVVIRVSAQAFRFGVCATRCSI